MKEGADWFCVASRKAFIPILKESAVQQWIATPQSRDSSSQGKAKQKLDHWAERRCTLQSPGKFFWTVDALAPLPEILI